MRINITGLGINLGITALVAIMVVLMPAVDRYLSAKLGLNLQGGVSEGRHAKGAGRLRKILLYCVFGFYLLAVSYVVFFSRAATEEYKIQGKFLNGLEDVIEVGFGPIDVLRAFIEVGPDYALRFLRDNAIHTIAELYLNIMLFVPMGYLLPYVFRWFRTNKHIRPVVACFLISLAIENIQLLTKHGFYDVDDLINNTLGGFIGQELYVLFAYVVTHPNWRKELKQYRRWKRIAKKRTLYPFVRRIALSRTTLFATYEEEVFGFYIDKLGCRLLRQTLPEDSVGTNFLLALGASEIEIRCSNAKEELREQCLTIATTRIEAVKRRLEENNIDVGDYEKDPYTARRCMHFFGPDNVRIQVIEA